MNGDRLDYWLKDNRAILVWETESGEGEVVQSYFVWGRPLIVVRTPSGGWQAYAPMTDRVGVNAEMDALRVRYRPHQPGEGYWHPKP